MAGAEEPDPLDALAAEMASENRALAELDRIRARIIDLLRACRRAGITWVAIGAVTGRAWQSLYERLRTADRKGPDEPM